MTHNSENTIAKSDIEENKIVAAIAYVLFFVPIIAAKDSAFARYHANQGLWLLIFSLLGNLIGFVLMFLLVGICLLPLVNFVWVVYVVIGMINATNGKMIPLPGFEKLPMLIK